MFSSEQKNQIADAVEKLLLSFNHPEMPTEKIKFALYIAGKEDFSWAIIDPNWKFENKAPGINPWNEKIKDNKAVNDKKKCLVSL